MTTHKTVLSLVGVAALTLLTSTASADTVVVYDQQFDDQPTWSHEGDAIVIPSGLAPDGTSYIRGAGDTLSRAEYQGSPNFRMRMRPDDGSGDTGTSQGHTHALVVLFDSSTFSAATHTLSFDLTVNANVEAGDYFFVEVWQADSTDGTYTIDPLPGLGAEPTVTAGTTAPSLLASADITSSGSPSLDFNYTGGEVILVFAAIDGTGDGADTFLLDNIQITTELVPTPAALPAGLAMLALAAMRRRRS